MEEEIKLIKSVLNHPSGMNIELMACLSIREHSDGYEVAWLEDGEGSLHDDGEYKDFDSLDEAAEFFCNKRREMHLGIDLMYKEI